MWGGCNFTEQIFNQIVFVFSFVFCCRYAFKLTYDEAVLGEVTNEDELVEYMTEYERDWYLGTETDRNWQLSIMDDKPFLFSLGRDKGKVGIKDFKNSNPTTDSIFIFTFFYSE